MELLRQPRTARLIAGRGCLSVIAAMLSLCCGAVRLDAATAHAAPLREETSAWERALRGRDVLEAIPAGSRTRADYARALDGFRVIYHDAPGDPHAVASIFAVAELLAEQGGSLHDRRSFEAAVGQYRFLRTQYPASSLAAAALFAEGQIERGELHDANAARERYRTLLREHPHSGLASAARAALVSLASGSETAPPKGGEQTPETSRNALPDAPSAASGVVSVPLEGTVADRRSALPRMATTGELAGARDTVPSLAQPRSADLPVAHAARAETPVQAAKGGVAAVTGIRHWSTRDYTRVAIDLGDEVTFEAARVPHPDRIIFDLHGTRLVPELVGKSFAVTDDGFLKRIRAAQATGDMTRVVLDVSEVSEYSAFLLPNPYRLIVDIHGRSKMLSVKDGAVEDVRPVEERVAGQGVPGPRVAQTVKPTESKPVPNAVPVKSPAATEELAALSGDPGKVDATNKPTSAPIAAVVAGTGGAKQAATGRKRGRVAAGEPAVPAQAAMPTAAGETSLVRALGLKIGRIVIDAGHGGHDSGTLGAGGLQEKDVVLDVALRLGKMLHDRLGAEIIYTRSDDTFIPLETRTAIANKAQADLFLSIHANSSPDESARGVETYYLNFTTQTDALQVAARENAVSGQSVHQLSDLVKKITLKDKIEESREFAVDVEGALYGGLAAGNEGLKNRGVKKAPFVVLIGANMPSILAEISFVTNERDAEQLRRPEYRQRVAESLFKGVAKYEAGLGETRVPVERASGN